MLKRFYFFLIILLIPIVGYAQMESILRANGYINTKKRASAYHTNAIYYNKGKLNLRIAIGFATDNNYVSSYQNIPGVFGILSPQYAISYSPTYNLFADYGITPKSQVGIGISFQQDYLKPASGYPYLPVGKVFWFASSIRYSHCIRSWKFFYYGAQFGTIFLKPSFDANTYVDRPSLHAPLMQAYSGFFLGLRVPVTNKLWFYFEGQGIEPIIKENSLLPNETFGLNYSFYRNKKQHKKT